MAKRKSDTTAARVSQSQQTKGKEATSPLHPPLAAAAILCDGDCRKSDRLIAPVLTLTAAGT